MRSSSLRHLALPVRALVCLVAFECARSFAVAEYCEILFEEMEGPVRADDLARAERVFDAVSRIIEEGTGVDLPDGGRTVDIPREHLEGLTGAFQKSYEDAADRHLMAAQRRAKADAIKESDPQEARRLREEADALTRGLAPFPIAVGNKGHMGDHDSAYKAAGEPIVRLTGIDPAVYQLALRAHDIGKGSIDELLAALVKEKVARAKDGKGPLRPEEIDEFVHNWVTSHEHHGIAQIPGVVKQYMKDQGMDPDGNPDHRRLYVYWSAQVMELVRYHNGTRLVENLRAAYPSLKDEEIAAVERAWWPNEYKKFAQIMGIKNDKYGSGKPVGPVGDVLNYFDRATLTTEASSPRKLMMQVGGKPDAKLDIEFLLNALVRPPAGNDALIKADADHIRKHGRERGASREERAAFEQAHGKILKKNDALHSLGLKIVEDQVEALKVPAFKGDVASGRAYLYYQAKGTGGKPGPWYRIDVTNKNNARIEKLDETGKLREYERGEGEPPLNFADALMEVFKIDRAWPPEV